MVGKRFGEHMRRRCSSEHGSSRRAWKSSESTAAAATAKVALAATEASLSVHLLYPAEKLGTVVRAIPGSFTDKHLVELEGFLQLRQLFDLPPQVCFFRGIFLRFLYQLSFHNCISFFYNLF